MFKKTINAITRQYHGQALKIKHASPTIMTVGGVGALLAAGVLAVRQTTHMNAVVTNFQHGLEAIEKEGRKPEYSDGDRMVMKAGVYTGLTIETLKVYMVPLALAATGTVAILYAHGIMRKREASLIAAYGILQRGFDAYRERVKESFGEAVEKQINDGHEVRVYVADDGENVKWEQKKDASVPRYGQSSEYAREFGQDSMYWSDSHPEMNLVYLRAQEKFANHKLQAKGHVFLNEIYDALGFKRSKAGAVVGWTRDGGDGFIDFGLFEPGSEEENDYFYYFNGNVPILVDFNVDGLILDEI